MSGELPDSEAAVTPLGGQTGPATAAGGTLVAHSPENVPPAGEDIHLPPGTPIPIIIAVGITLMLVGTTTDWVWTIIGGLMFLVALGLWIRDTVREVDHLPDEHGSPAHH